MPASGTAQKMKFSITDFFSKCDQIQQFTEETLLEREILLKKFS